MGTFHDHLGELHGITVVVEATDGVLYVGRCHEARDDIVHMMNLDIYDPASSHDFSQQEWLKRAAQWGIFPKERVLKIPGDNVKRIIRLGAIDPHTGLLPEE